MLQENIRMLRKARGLSQEEVAQRLHVTRQTLSKWENGLSVPDTQLLRRLAEVLKVPVARLLDSPDEPTEGEDQDTVAQQLERLNLLLAERNRRSRRIWRVVAGVLVGAAVLTALCLLLSLTALRSLTAEPQVSAGDAVIVDTADSGTAGAMGTASGGRGSSPENG